MNINFKDTTLNEIHDNYVCVFIAHATLKTDMTPAQNQNVINSVSHVAII